MLNFNNKVPTDIKIGNKTVETVWMRNEIVWGRVQTPLYIQNTYNGTNTVSVKQTLSGSPDSSTYAKHLQYSKDGLNWTTITLSSTAYTISLAKNEKVYFRGNEGVFNYWTSGGSQKAITTISASQNHTVGGNINSLLDYTDPYCLTLPQGAFNSMFENDTHLTSASDLTLPSSLDGSLSTYAYLYMFKGCSSLTSAPQSIPAKVQGQDACNGMFANCTSLKAAPALPATTLAASCYWSMFEGCTALTSAPVLPATTMETSCYRSMFQGCSSLTTAPALPATTLASNCYQQMFRYCTSLTTAPSVIPAGTSSYMCCQRMFSDCTALTSVPTLPATIVESGCYQYMFFGCTSLTTAPTELPATTLTPNCYYSMFEGCNKLTSSPVIKATTFAKQSCTVMFRNCTSLNNVTVCADDNSAENCTDRWLYNVAATGTFHNYGIATYTIDSPSGIPQGWTEVKHKNYFYVENENNGQNTIKVTVTGTPVAGQTATSIDYSTDKTNWTTITITKNLVTDIVLSNKGDKLYFKNNSGYLNNNIVNGFRVKFYATNNYSVGGDTTTLWNSDYDVNKKMPEGCLRGLFSPEGDIITGVYNENLIDSSRLVFRSVFLPVVSSKKRIPNGAYYSMFGKCINMVNGPSSIPADTIGESSCYWMFYWNVKLKNAPTLQATKVETLGYYGMFIYCNKLEIAPTLPATTIGDKSYRDMFWKCVTITAAPTISATTLGEESMTGMFIDCRNMTTGPELFAKTLKRACYSEMYQGCTSLNEVTIYADNISAAACLKDWLSGVAATGTFHNLGSATYPTNSTSGIPSGWTEVHS